MGEGHIRRGSPPEPDSAFHFALADPASTATGLGRASSASASLLKLGQNRPIQGTITAEPCPVSSLTSRRAWFASSSGNTVTCGRILRS